MKTSYPSEIYTFVLSEINNLIRFLETETTDDEIRKSQEDALKQLAGINSEVSIALEGLQKNAEWDVFSVAFYGETNAGKSTLIETLRILLREPTKEAERCEFNKIKDSLQDIPKQIEQSKNQIEQINMEYQLKINEFEEKINFINLHIADGETLINLLKGNIDEIENQIKVKRKSSIVKFLMALFGILNEQKEHRLFSEEMSNCKSEVASLYEEKQKIADLMVSMQDEWDIKGKIIKDSVENLEKEANQISGMLTEYCDGKIIGDGHSDFTRNVTTYQFEYNEQKFALLDLPGIEGKEELVINVINDAVQKAHAVFFVSGKPTPPQTGDGEKDGTLEKIKKHLGQHTEVYTVFNKRIRNPQHLHPSLTDEDDHKCLQEHDTIMRASLGEQYEKHIVLSAYPAFLSIANCSNNDFEKAQKKFYEKFESQECLLQASLMKSFSEWITKDLVNNCKAKIKKSNYKKVSIVLTLTGEKLHEIQSGLHDLQTKLIKTKKATDDQLDRAAEILKQQLVIKAYNNVDEFKTIFRTNIYIDIDKELNSDAYKISLKCRTDEATNILSQIFKENFDIAMTEFENDVSDIIDKHNRYASELLDAYHHIAKFDFDFKPNIEIKGAVNWAVTITSIIGSIGGVILCLTNPVGWVVLILSIIGAGISIWKAVSGFLNHKYRASQQKKNADENIEKIGKLILESVLNNIEAAHNPLQDGIADIKGELQNSINYIESMNQLLLIAETKFKSLTMTVEKEGESLNGYN